MKVQTMYLWLCNKSETVMKVRMMYLWLRKRSEIVKKVRTTYLWLRKRSEIVKKVRMIYVAAQLVGKSIIGTVLVLVLKNERFVKFFIPILSQVIGTIKYSKIPSFCCCSY